MIGRRPFLASLVAWTGAAFATRDDRLKLAIEGRIAEAKPEIVAVAFSNLAGGEEILINPDHAFHAASTMKIGVLMEVFHQAGQGIFRLDDRMDVKNQFASIVDGSAYKLDPKDDSEFTLYDRLGQKETIRELSRLMIVRSSNLATNLLIEKVGAEKVMAFMKEQGAPSVKILRGVEDSKAFAKGLNNTTTARGLMTLLKLLAERKAVSPEASDAMLAILRGQEFREGIPAGLPEGTAVAHKTGWIKGAYHDAALISPKGHPGYVLVVLTKGIADEKKAHALVSDISRMVHQQVVPR